jgi:anti-anti-sigma regulatory factor
LLPARGGGKFASGPMTEPSERMLASLRASQACFREHYLRAARFREDAALADELVAEAAPVLEALVLAFEPTEGPRALHEGYALLNLLGRRAAILGATPSVALAVPQAIAAALRDAGCTVDSSAEAELAIVALEGYCAARDERTAHQLRRQAASQQFTVALGPRCVGLFLAGTHEESELSPLLEGAARELLRGDVLSVLLDLSRLDPVDEELARALGRFCAHAATLGVCTFVFGAQARLREQFRQWSLTHAVTAFVDDFALARTQALAAAGLALRPRSQWAPRWARLFFPARGALVR